jgi:hypothetical protein
VSHGSLEVGQAGVETALDILDSELRMVMRQADTPSLGRSRSSCMRDRRPPAWQVSRPEPQAARRSFRRRQDEALDDEKSLVDLAESDLDVAKTGVEAFHAPVHLGAELPQLAARVVDPRVHPRDQRDHQGSQTHTGRQDGRHDPDPGSDDPLRVRAHPGSIAPRRVWAESPARVVP